MQSAKSQEGGCIRKSQIFNGFHVALCPVQEFRCFGTLAACLWPSRLAYALCPYALCRSLCLCPMPLCPMPLCLCAYAYGLWPMTYALCPMPMGLWAYGLWPMAYGAYGLWPMATDCADCMLYACVHVYIHNVWALKRECQGASRHTARSLKSASPRSPPSVKAKGS